MHKLLLVGLSAASLFGAALSLDRADAMGISGAPGVQSAQDQLRLIEKVDRVCRRDCDDGFCKTRCFFTHDDDDRDRRVFRDRDRDHDRDHDRGRDHDRDRRDCSRVGPVVVCN